MKRTRAKSSHARYSRPAERESDTALIDRLLSRLRVGSDVRKTKIRRIKAALRQQSYFNLLKLDVAADRMADDLTKQP